MSLPTSMLRVLLSKGIDASTILEMSELADAEQAARDAELAAADEAKREKRRESNRRRQKAWYDRHVRGECDNAVSLEDNQDNGVRDVKTVRLDEQKKVLEPKKNPTGIITSSTPSGSQVSSPSKPRRHPWPADYRSDFWDGYPRKTDHKKAIVSLDRIYRADCVPYGDIIAGRDRMKDSGLEKRFIPHATTFLNNERWNDDWPNVVPRGARQTAAGCTADFWAGTAIDGNEGLNGGRHDTGPFDTDEQSWHRPGNEGGRRHDESSSQQAGTDPWRLPALRVVGGR